MSCDCEPSEIYEEVERKARKQHRCCECGTIINAGEHYIVINSLYDGRWNNSKHCQDCIAVANKLTSVTGCCYPIGDLYQELIDCDFLVRDQETELYEESVDWLELIQQQPLKCRLKE